MLAHVSGAPARSVSFSNRSLQQCKPVPKHFRRAVRRDQGRASAAGRGAFVIAAMADLAEFEKTKGALKGVCSATADGDELTIHVTRYMFEHAGVA
jgi:hypothetical protein